MSNECNEYLDQCFMNLQPGAVDPSPIVSEQPKSHDPQLWKKYWASIPDEQREREWKLLEEAAGPDGR